MFLVILFLAAQTAAAPFAGPGLAQEEAVLSAALAIRARVLEADTGFRFNAGWQAKARLEYLSFGRGQSAAGQYEVATGELLIALSMWSELNREMGRPLRLATAPEVAAVADFQRIADHELGHALSDQISRRNGLGPWFTEEFKQSLVPAESFGLNVVTEGVGTFFEHHGRLEVYPSGGEGWFPAPDESQLGCDYDTVAYRGGVWVVQDVLRQHGERGLIWLIAHPLSLDYSNMRAAAVAYRTRALAELAAGRSR